jgi:hypothetical protein
VWTPIAERQEEGGTGVDAATALRSALAMRAPCDSGRSRSPGRILSQRNLLQLLNLGVLPRSYLFDHELNRGNYRLANLYELHARKSSLAGFLGESPFGTQGIPHSSQAALGRCRKNSEVAMLECAKGIIFAGVQRFEA